MVEGRLDGGMVGGAGMLQPVEAIDRVTVPDPALDEFVDRNFEHPILRRCVENIGAAARIPHEADMGQVAPRRLLQEARQRIRRLDENEIPALQSRPYFVCLHGQGSAGKHAEKKAGC